MTQSKVVVQVLVRCRLSTVRKCHRTWHISQAELEAEILNIRDYISVIKGSWKREKGKHYVGSGVYASPRSIQSKPVRESRKRKPSGWLRTCAAARRFRLAPLIHQDLSTSVNIMMVIAEMNLP